MLSCILLVSFLCLWELSSADALVIPADHHVLHGWSPLSIKASKHDQILLLQDANTWIRTVYSTFPLKGETAFNSSDCIMDIAAASNQHAWVNIMEFPDDDGLVNYSYLLYVDLGSNTILANVSTNNFTSLFQPIAVDSKGTVYAIDNGTVWSFTANGQLLGNFSLDDSLSQYELMIEIDSSDTLWILSSGKSPLMLVHYSLAGQLLSSVRIEFGAGSRTNLVARTGMPEPRTAAEAFPLLVDVMTIDDNGHLLIRWQDYVNGSWFMAVYNGRTGEHMKQFSYTLPTLDDYGSTGITMFINTLAFLSGPGAHEYGVMAIDVHTGENVVNIPSPIE